MRAARPAASPPGRPTRRRLRRRRRRRSSARADCRGASACATMPPLTATAPSAPSVMIAVATSRASDDGGFLRIGLARQQRGLARVHDERAGGSRSAARAGRRTCAPGRCRRWRRCAARPDRRGFPRCRRSRRAAPAARHRPRAAGAHRRRARKRARRCSRARRSPACARRAARSSRRPRRPAVRPAASRGRPGRRARRAPRADRARLQAMATLQAPPGATSERAACASSPCAGRASSPSRMTSTLAAPTHATSCSDTYQRATSVARSSRMTVTRI